MELLRGCSLAARPQPMASEMEGVPRLGETSGGAQGAGRPRPEGCDSAVGSETPVMQPRSPADGGVPDLREVLSEQAAL